MSQARITSAGLFLPLLIPFEFAGDYSNCCNSGLFVKRYWSIHITKSSFSTSALHIFPVNDGNRVLLCLPLSGKIVALSIPDRAHSVRFGRTYVAQPYLLFFDFHTDEM
jgi:hypothetical protein